MSLFGTGYRIEFRRLWPLMTLMIAIAFAANPKLFVGSAAARCEIFRSLRPPSFPAHPFGFDLQGCDLLSLSILGTRASMIVGFGSALLAAVFAAPLGAVAGAMGGAFDALVGRATDLLTGLPIVLVALVFLTGVENRGVGLVVLVLAIAAWPIHMRVARSVAMRVTTEPFVDASRALGASSVRILLRHVMPRSIMSLITVAPTTVAFSIGVEAVLSFLGAGLQLPTVSWGVLLGEAQLNIRRAPHLLLPGLFLVAVAAALVSVGEAWRHRPPGGRQWERIPTGEIGPQSSDQPGAMATDAVTVLDPRRRSDD